MTKLIYLQGYPESLLAQVTTLIEQGRLGEVLQSAIRKGTTLTAIKRCISTPDLKTAFCAARRRSTKCMTVRSTC